MYINKQTIVKAEFNPNSIKNIFNIDTRAAVVDLKWADDDFVRPKNLRASLSLS